MYAKEFIKAILLNYYEITFQSKLITVFNNSKHKGFLRTKVTHNNRSL